MFALVSILGAGAGVEAGDLDPERVPWTRLRYEARKLFFSGTTEVRLAGPRSDLAGELIESPRGAALEADPGGRTPGGPDPGRPDPQLSRLTLESAFAGRRSEVEVWFDPGTAAALQRRKQRYGKKAYEKIYRFTADGVFSRRRSPRISGRRGSEWWGRLEEEFYRYPGERGGCPVVAEPTVLFYLLAAAELTPGEPLAVCTFSRRDLSRIEVWPAGAATLRVDYAELSGGERRQRQGEIETLRVTVRARANPRRPLDGGEFEFLGLVGDVEIFVAGGVPVEVRGRLPRFGRVQVRLVEVELRGR